MPDADVAYDKALLLEEAAPPPSWIPALGASACMGAVFGTAFAKSHVFEPMAIRAQFLFQKWVMLKMFLGAMGTGAICLAVLSVAAPRKFTYGRRLWEPTGMIRGPLTGTALGALILGAGMATAGACPGMVLSQLGAGVPNSAVTVLGGLGGVLVYGLVDREVTEHVMKRGPQGPSQVYGDQWLGGAVPYWQLAAGLGAGCLLFAAALEYLIPWQSEVPLRLLPQMQACLHLWDCPAWPPTLAGVLLGLMQVPAVLFVQTFLGSATSYQVCGSSWIGFCSRSVQDRFPYHTKFAKPQVASWWQIPYVGLAVLASFLWEASVNDVGQSQGVSLPAAFTGGFLMLFGSRMGGGCTSGHGISGCAILLLHSFIAVPAMFGGGIVVAFAWNALADGFVL